MLVLITDIALNILVTFSAGRLALESKRDGCDLKSERTIKGIVSALKKWYHYRVWVETCANTASLESRYVVLVFISNSNIARSRKKRDGPFHGLSHKIIMLRTMSSTN